MKKLILLLFVSFSFCLTNCSEDLEKEFADATTYSFSANSFVPHSSEQKCTRMIKGPNKTKITIEGLNFFIKNFKILGVGKFEYSRETLDAITQAVVICDGLNYSCCQQLNRIYSASPVDTSLARYITERQFDVTLKLGALAIMLKANPTENDSLRKKVENLLD